MKVRSVNEVKSLDDEISLFEEDEWSFMGVVESHETNYEYFNDIRDTDFDKQTKGQILEKVFIAVTMFIVLCTCVIVIHSTGVLDMSGVNEMNNIQTSNTGLNASSHVDGDEVSSSDFIAIQNVVNEYIKVIEVGKSYDRLYDLCQTTSVFADTYESNTSKIKEVFDKNDCYARALREFGCACSINKVVNVVDNDDIYYCYVTISVPTNKDVSEYIYRNQYNLLKHFNGYLPTETEIFKYLFETMAQNPLPTTSQEFCVKFVKNDDKFLITDDSFLASICIDSYSSAVYQALKVIGEGVTIGK